MKKLNPIPIFIPSDDFFLKFLSVTMLSIIKNTTSNVIFYILDGGISIKNKRKLRSIIVRHRNCDIEFLKMDNKIFSVFNTKCFSINAFYRYVIPILKKDITKAIYIDADIIITGNIEELYQISLEDYKLAAVPYIQETLSIEKSRSWTNYEKIKLNIKDEHKYFNSGLLILDCEGWRREGIVSALLSLTEQLNNELEYPDQDVLNIYFACNYKKLDSKYNQIVDLLVAFKMYHPAMDYNSSIYGIHFTNGCMMRPWEDLNCPFSRYFWEYAVDSPFLYDMKTYLMCKEIMRFQTKYL